MRCGSKSYCKRVCLTRKCNLWCKDCVLVFVRMIVRNFNESYILFDALPVGNHLSAQPFHQQLYTPVRNHSCEQLFLKKMVLSKVGKEHSLASCSWFLKNFGYHLWHDCMFFYSWNCDSNRNSSMHGSSRGSDTSTKRVVHRAGNVCINYSKEIWLDFLNLMSIDSIDS
jgi:hypothetical protein